MPRENKLPVSTDPLKELPETPLLVNSVRLWIAHLVPSVDWDNCGGALLEFSRMAYEERMDFNHLHFNLGPMSANNLYQNIL